MVNNAKTLKELLAIICEYEEAHSLAVSNGDSDEYKALGEQIDLCSLPTFGDQPEDTTECFSWDDEKKQQRRR